VTLLPALLLLIGKRMNWPRSLTRREPAKIGLWARWGREAMARPWRYLIPSLVVLALFIVPTMRLKTWNMGARDLSQTMEARQGYDLLDRNFSAGWMGPVALLIETPDAGTVWTPQREKAVAAIYARLAADPRVRIAGGFPQLLGLLGPAAEAFIRDPICPAGCKRRRHR
jgi:Predicted drug exporters of the RND superfamily